MIKDDQGGTRNPYKRMIVMKQDAMDDKIIERCKTCEKQISQQGKKMSYSQIQNTHTHTHKTSLTNFIYQKQVKTVQ